MLGVMRETLEREGGSMRGEEDFFSVARTMPLVAEGFLGVRWCLEKEEEEEEQEKGVVGGLRTGEGANTFDPEGGDALVDGC